MPSRRASVTGLKFDGFNNLHSSNMIKSNRLKIITCDAGASGLHSHAGAWEREMYELYKKEGVVQFSPEIIEAYLSQLNKNN